VSGAALRPGDPHADAILAPFAAHVEARKRSDQPFLERCDEAAHVRHPALEVEHHIGDALAGAVIGELPAAPDRMHREARVGEVLRPGAGAGGIERRVLQQPDEFRSASVRDRRDPCLHGGKRALIAHRRFAHAPRDRSKTRRLQAKSEIVARVNHRVTIAW
jgi:hypothetical protein